MDKLDLTPNPPKKMRGAKLFLFNIVNIIVADALAPCITKTSETMILTM